MNAVVITAKTPIHPGHAELLEVGHAYTIGLATLGASPADQPPGWLEPAGERLIAETEAALRAKGLPTKEAELTYGQIRPFVATCLEAALAFVNKSV